MHDTAAAGGYPLDSSRAGGPQLEITAPGPCGRRTARRPGTAGAWSLPPAPGPIYGGPAPSGRAKDERTDGQRRSRTATSHRPPACASLAAGASRNAEAAPRPRIDSYTQTRTPWGHLFADSHLASKPGGLGPAARSQLGCGRRRAASRPWRNGDSDSPGRPVRGRCGSPTKALTRGLLACPATPAVT